VVLIAQGPLLSRLEPKPRLVRGLPGMVARR